MQYEKTYKPVLVNFDIKTLAKIDRYKGPSRSRTRLIHEALEHYSKHLELQGVRMSSWTKNGS